MLILDDVSINDLHNKSLYNFLKSSHHYKCKTIISSQHYCDLNPNSRNQISYLLLFPRLDNERLKMIYKCSSFSIPITEFMEIYDKVTRSEGGKKSYNFLYCDLINSEFRQNFNKRIIID